MVPGPLVSPPISILVRPYTRADIAYLEDEQDGSLAAAQRHPDSLFAGVAFEDALADGTLAIQRMPRESSAERRELRGALEAFLTQFPTFSSRDKLFWNVLIRMSALGEFEEAKRRLHEMTGLTTTEKAERENLLSDIAPRGTITPPTYELYEVTTGKYHPGQVWKFKARPGERSPTLTIVRVESGPGLPVIVHVQLEGVRVANPYAPDGFSHAVGHAPFTEDAIARSVTKLVGRTKTLPLFEDGYDDWRKGFDQGKAGVYSITVGEALAAMEATFRNARPRAVE